MPKLNFIPARDGFHFNNNFNNIIIGNIHAGAGLCGGMSLAAYNYFISNIPVPTHNSDDGDFGKDTGTPPANNPVPPLHSKLRDYIVGMQWETFPFCVPFIIHLGINTPVEHFNSCLPEFEIAKKILKKGNYCLLGLRGSTGDHQVLAYGYDLNPSRLYIYDCNASDQETVLTLDGRHTQLLHNGNSNVYLSFFNMMDLNPAIPATGLNTPTYVDLGIKSGLTVTTNGTLEAPATFTVTIKNFGDFNAHVNSFLIWLRDPTGQNIDYMTGGTKSYPLRIAPSEEVIISGQYPRLGTVPGNYTAGVWYLSKQNHWIDIPAKDPGTISQVVFNLRKTSNQLIVTYLSNYISATQVQLTFIVKDAVSGQLIQTYQVISQSGSVLGGSNTPIIANVNIRTTITKKIGPNFTIEFGPNGKPRKMFEQLTCTNKICTPGFENFTIKAPGYLDNVIRVNYNSSVCV